MFGKKKPQTPKYDAATKLPVLRKSICTGETTAGFQDLTTGKFSEVMLIRTPKDLDDFMKQYGIPEPPKIVY